MMKIEVLGPGCPKCNALFAAAKSTAQKLGLACEVTKVTDLAKITAYGVMFTPALVVDGKVRISGKVPSDAEITSILTSAKAG